MKIEVRKVKTEQDLIQCFEIRKEVFMVEQMVSEPDEFDGLDEESHHYVAFLNDIPVGAARWRWTEDEKIKLERFAVLKKARRNGVGEALVQKVLSDVTKHNPDKKPVYLHAQVEVVPLYSKHGFIADGKIFEECNIMHQTMVLHP